MPLWAVIFILGAAFSGWCFLKAREADSKNTLKKVKAGHKSVMKAARAAAARPSTIVEKEVNSSSKEVNMSRDVPSKVAAEIEEIQKRKREG